MTTTPPFLYRVGGQEVSPLFETRGTNRLPLLAAPIFSIAYYDIFRNQ